MFERFFYILGLLSGLGSPYPEVEILDSRAEARDNAVVCQFKASHLLHRTLEDLLRQGIVLDLSARVETESKGKEIHRGEQVRRLTWSNERFRLDGQAMESLEAFRTEAEAFTVVLLGDRAAAAGRRCTSRIRLSLNLPGYRDALTLWGNEPRLVLHFTP